MKILQFLDQWPMMNVSTSKLALHEGGQGLRFDSDHPPLELDWLVCASTIKKLIT
jgi:hypothetical protein